MSSGGAQKTRRAKTRGANKPRVTATTIPELKRSFDTLEKDVSAILRDTLSQPQRVKRFQEVWRRIFGRPVDASAASAYLAVKARRVGGKTRKGGKQNGGAAAAALAGAPLDFQTRPGVDGAYGSFNQYITNGFGFYNTINQNAMSKECGMVDITPRVPAELGSNKVGGGMIGDALAAIGTRPATAAAPPSFTQDLQDMWSGRPVGQSPAAEQTRLAYR